MLLLHVLLLLLLTLGAQLLPPTATSAARGDPAEFSLGDDSLDDSLDDAEEEHGRDMGDAEIAEDDRISSGALVE